MGFKLMYIISMSTYPSKLSTKAMIEFPGHHQRPDGGLMLLGHVQECTPQNSHRDHEHNDRVCVCVCMLYGVCVCVSSIITTTCNKHLDVQQRQHRQITRNDSSFPFLMLAKMIRDMTLVDNLFVLSMITTIIATSQRDKSSRHSEEIDPTPCVWLSYQQLTDSLCTVMQTLYTYLFAANQQRKVFFADKLPITG